MKPEQRRKQIRQYDADIEELQRARKELIDSCKHEEKVPSFPKLLSASTPICVGCGKRFDGWWCPSSPDKQCHYSSNYDCCDYCGEPEERK